MHGPAASFVPSIAARGSPGLGSSSETVVVLNVLIEAWCIQACLFARLMEHTIGGVFTQDDLVFFCSPTGEHCMG